jgi:hypothetical protein
VHNKACTTQGSDRTSKGSARAVFNSLYRGYREVMVVGATAGAGAFGQFIAAQSLNMAGYLV